MPRKATTHIQNSAPGPPVYTATATPAMLPVPTREARLVVSAWMGVMPWLSFSGVRVTERMNSPNLKSCRKRSRMEK